MSTEGILFNHIHHALDQVRELRARVIENQIFQGYSGSARAMGGLLALLAAFIMSLPWYPKQRICPYECLGSACLSSSPIKLHCSWCLVFGTGKARTFNASAGDRCPAASCGRRDSHRSNQREWNAQPFVCCLDVCFWLGKYGIQKVIANCCLVSRLLLYRLRCIIVYHDAGN